MILTLAIDMLTTEVQLSRLLAHGENNMQPDIQIDGQGFYTISGVSREGKVWVNKLVQNAEHGQALTDDSRFASDIADGAHEDGLEVAVNGRLYAGNGRVWTDPFIYELPCWLKEAHNG